MHYIISLYLNGICNYILLTNGVIFNIFLIYRATERANPYFVLQRRKGHGTKGLSSLLVGTLDSVFDTRPPPFRILHQTPSSEVSYIIACSLNREEIVKDWLWLEANLIPTLDAFDSEDEIADFVKCKIESIIAQEATPVAKQQVESIDSSNFKAAVHRFQEVFGMPPEEKLVSCKFNHVNI